MLGLETKSWLQLEFWILILELSPFLFLFLFWHPVCDLVHVRAHSLREKISDANWSWSSSPWAGRWQRTLVLSWSVSRRSCAGCRQEPGKMLIDDTKDCIIVWIKTGFAIFFSPSSWQDTAMHWCLWKLKFGTQVNQFVLKKTPQNNFFHRCKHHCQNGIWNIQIFASIFLLSLIFYKGNLRQN